MLSLIAVIFIDSELFLSYLHMQENFFYHLKAKIRLVLFWL
jgi:hypothetical protein